ncbi:MULTISPECIES: non-ribosomal peptide synthetase [Trichocoleus]|nr:non-ribosomal peptide synthetase [Trichocoleus sp. FACHB-46]MBD1865229.1 amino acid adenylation domain-containing protein [Trichocoleus sp. FACHB-46]
MNNSIREVLIHNLFEAQAQRSPSAIAVVCEQGQLTYHALNARANQLARHLQTLGVGPDVLVGLCVDRSLEMLVGILAILKAGSAYVPLDPAYPKDRLAWMLEDSQVSVLLAQTGTLPSLPDHCLNVFCLDADWEKITDYDPENLASQATAANLAYIIYTSGSTGKPKGVMIEHRSLVNYTQAVIDAYEMSDRDRVLQFASISFDASAEEIYPCLCVGAALVLRSELMLASVSTFLQACQTWQLTVLSLPTAYWHELTARLETDQLALPASLRLVVIGGERALPTRLAVWQQQVGKRVRLLNTYGPTESTVIATLYDLSEAVIDLTVELPIGKAIANIQTYVLDQHLQPVPLGESGELWIAGAGLARGYLNRPDLTAEKFIPNFFLRDEEQRVENGNGSPTSHFSLSAPRLYKTGDLVRQRLDGNLEYLGRIDDQVKIRGFRIELGELEALLGQHPQVETAVVIAREDVLGDKQLVAYVVPKAGSSEQSTLQLRSFMQEQLPIYMVPTAFVRLESLPLTVNGKIDRRALPAPDRTTFEPAEYIAPHTTTEAQLANIWAEVLKLERVGITDNFFELGGHSLLGTQVVSRIRDLFQVEVPLRHLFNAPTIAELGKHLEAVGVERSPLDTIQPIPRTEKLLLSFAQQRLWFLDQLVPNSAFYNIPQALQLNGSLNVAAFEQSLNEIVQRHESLKTTFAAVDGQPFQVIAPTLNVPLPVIDLRSLPQHQREIAAQSHVIAAAQQPFDLAQGPLFRCHLWQIDEAKYILLLTMHHIISDGWSIGVLIQELAALYEAHALNQPSPLPKLAIQYADFAQWQRHSMQHRGQEQLAYWKQQLAGAPAVMELPTDHPRPSVQTFRGGVQSFLLPAALNPSIEFLSQQMGITPFMTLLAAFQLLLYRYTRQHDVVVGSPIANRHRAEVEALIGFFINTLVLRTDLSGNPTVSDLLKRVREVALEAYAHQDLPFEQLVEALHPDRNLSHTPLFQVMFVLQNAPTPSLELAGVILHPLQLENGARLDLTVAMDSTEQELARFDLTLSLEYTEHGLLGIWEYNTELFEADTIARMAGHYQTLLEGIVAHPECHLSELPILTPTEQSLLTAWNQTDAAYTTNLCIHEQFEAQVSQSPQAIAVVFHQTQLTYQELNDRANQLAHHLKQLGVKPESLVGLCVERSPEMIVGLLGILKAGGAYVPLDPSYPKERIAAMVGDAQVGVLLTQSKWLATLPDTSAQIVCLDRDWKTIAQQPCENPVHHAQPNNLAYVIYTSGSTGKPKGVMIEHRSLVNFTQAAIAAYEMTASDRILQFASVSFDTAAEEIYPCLTTGGTLVLRTDEMLGSVATFMHQCQELHLTVLDLPTAYWHQLTTQLASAQLKLPASLRLVILGGEAALPAQVATWNTYVGDRPKLMNTYGPTETTIVATAASLSQPAITDKTAIPIGRPLSNVQVYVLDQDLQPLPIGVPGELYIGGAGLARGYLNRPELTAEKFIPNPFFNHGKTSLTPRLYKTGDLVRFRADGNLEYFGRLDQQVKVRGFRVELGDIESALGQHPGVQEAVVLASDDVQGNKRLIAYVVSNLIPDRVPMQIPCRVEAGDRTVELCTEDLSLGGLCLGNAPDDWQRGQPVQLCLQLPTTTEPIFLEGQVAWNQEQRVGIQLSLTALQQALLQQAVHHLLEAQGFLRTLQRTLTENLRQFLQSKLPDYMIPSGFMLLTTLPMTPNGKIDRNALPTFNPALTTTATDFVAPRTAVEEVMAEIWAEVLGLEQVSTHANFFELGGHSLLGVQIISRLRTIFQVELPLRSLFEAPTIANLAQALEIESHRNDQQAAPPLLPVQRDRSLPLSFSQEMMWVLAQLQPNVPYYNHTFALRWSGALNQAALEQALQEIVRRHEIWRTTYTTIDGLPVQVVQAATKFTVHCIDLQSLPEGDRAAEAIRQVTADVHRPFDLSADLLLRSTLVQYTETEYQLFITLHHISYDGLSLSILLQELEALYMAFQAGKPSPLPELPIQYADYAFWQRRWLQPDVLEPHLAYWKQQLTDLPTLQLPTDYPPPANPTFAGASYSLAFSKELTNKLKALCRKESVTLFITLQAAFQTLLARYTGQTDIPVGFITAGRDRPELENLLGFFANFLVLRSDLSGNPTFRELLVRVREVALAAYTHQHVPFQKLVEVSRSDRRLGQNPLYQVMLLLDPPMSNDTPGWTLEYPSPVENGTVTCDLLITLSEGADGLTGQLSYSTELFSAETIARMAGHFQTLLEGIVSNPDGTLAALPLLPIAEQQQLQAWNQTQVAYPLEICLHQWIEMQVERTPDAVAVSFEGQHLTYRELNERANQLAHYLQTLGVKPDTLVGICVDRSLEMVIGLLSILKAGGAYVPFDPSYPSDRLAFMLEDAQVPILLTQAYLVDQLPPHQAQTLCLDTDWQQIAQGYKHNPDSGVTSDNLAYVIYTSGSTGKPKGAMNTHRGICNRLLWMQDEYQLTKDDRVLQKTPFSFDVSVWEFFWPLMSGARLVVARPEGHKDPAYLVQVIAEQQITTLHFVPSMLRVFLEEPGVERCDSIRQVMCSGEALPLDLQNRFFERCSAQLHNLYGPTEAAVDVTYWHCQPEADQRSVPIGRPIANTQMYVLDSQLQPVPIGIVGELYIGGVNVARGYLNRPELTAERFIHDPFVGNGEPPPTPRLYKTGDLACYRPDGAIDYLGRIDHQVKLRGFRIELGEIESVLTQHPTVQAAIVIDRETALGDKQLVAYVVALPGQTILSQDLQAFLHQQLPEYMVPAAVVTLDTLPVNANGKLDRKALPAPEQTQSETPFVAPQTLIEKTLAGIWQDVLGLEQISIHDNFLELGGHSLLATQVISRSRSLFQVDISLRHLFESPTVTALATVIEQLQGSSSVVPAIGAISRSARRVKRSSLQ